MPRAPRLPAHPGEPAEPWLLPKQIELSTKPEATLIYLLCDEVGCELIAKGILPGYVQIQAQEALDWNCVEARKPFHEQEK